MVNGEFVDKILNIAGKDHEVKEINGFTYHVSKNGVELVEEPKVDLTKLFSLNQACKFIASLVSGDSAGEVINGKNHLLVNVINEKKVEIVDAMYGSDLGRNVYAELDASEIFPEFKSTVKMSQEEFIIELLTKFVQDDATLELLNLVSSVKSDNETSFKDSGFTQTVNVKAGVTLVNQKEIKNLFQLRTYRTFPEVEQPVIPYILRLHDGGRDGKPLFALYPADGGQWKVEATKQIREYLTNNLNSTLAEKSSAITIL